MIQARELRLGNIVGAAHLYGPITSFVRDRVDVDCGSVSIHEEVSMLKPIDLNVEWLEKFGFELNSEAHHKFPNIRDLYDKNKIVQRIDRIYKFQYEPDDFMDGEHWRNIEMLQVIDPETMKQRSLSLKKTRNQFIVTGDIRYVHTLQNLYFALIGEELEIKQ